MALNTLLNVRIHTRWNPIHQLYVWFLRTPLGWPFRAKSTPLCGKGCACDATTGCTAT